MPVRPRPRRPSRAEREELARRHRDPLLAELAASGDLGAYRQRLAERGRERRRQDRLDSRVVAGTAAATVLVFVLGHVFRSEVVTALGALVPSPVALLLLWNAVPCASLGVVLLRRLVPVERGGVRRAFGVAAVLPWWPFLAVVPGRGGGDDFEAEVASVLPPEQADAFLAGFTGALFLLLAAVFVVLGGLGSRGWRAAAVLSLLPLLTVVSVVVGFRDAVPSGRERALVELSARLEAAVPVGPAGASSGLLQDCGEEEDLLGVALDGCRAAVAGALPDGSSYRLLELRTEADAAVVARRLDAAWRDGPFVSEVLRVGRYVIALDDDADAAAVEAARRVLADYQGLGA